MASYQISSFCSHLARRASARASILQSDLGADEGLQNFTFMRRKRIVWPTTRARATGAAGIRPTPLPISNFRRQCRLTNFISVTQFRSLFPSDLWASGWQCLAAKVNAVQCVSVPRGRSFVTLTKQIWKLATVRIRCGLVLAMALYFFVVCLIKANCGRCRSH